MSFHCFRPCIECCRIFSQFVKQNAFLHKYRKLKSQYSYYTQISSVQARQMVLNL